MNRRILLEAACAVALSIASSEALAQPAASTPAASESSPPAADAPPAERLLYPKTEPRPLDSATSPPSEASRPATQSSRFALAGGLSYFATHVTSVAALFLYQDILNDPNYIIGSGPDTKVKVGAFLELILAFGVVGSSITLYPLVKEENEAVAMGYVALRTLEAGIIVMGIVSLLSVVTMREQHEDGMGDADSLVPLGRSLVAFHDWTFLLGPGFTSGFNTLFMAYLMNRTELVPEWISVLGMIGGTLGLGSAVAVLFGLIPQYGTAPALLAIPIFAWELSLASYLVYRGLSPSDPFRQEERVSPVAVSVVPQVWQIEPGQAPAVGVGLRATW